MLTTKRAILVGPDNKILEAWVLSADFAPWREPDAVLFGCAEITKDTAVLRGVSGRKFTDYSGFEMIPDADSVYARAIKAIKNLDA